MFLDFQKLLTIVFEGLFLGVVLRHTICVTRGIIRQPIGFNNSGVVKLNNSGPASSGKACLVAEYKRPKLAPAQLSFLPSLCNALR